MCWCDRSKTKYNKTACTDNDYTVHFGAFNWHIVKKEAKIICHFKIPIQNICYKCQNSFMICKNMRRLTQCMGNVPTYFIHLAILTAAFWNYLWYDFFSIYLYCTTRLFAKLFPKKMIRIWYENLLVTFKVVDTYFYKSSMSPRRCCACEPPNCVQFSTTNVGITTIIYVTGTEILNSSRVVRMSSRCVS